MKWKVAAVAGWLVAVRMAKMTVVLEKQRVAALNLANASLALVPLRDMKAKDVAKLSYLTRQAFGLPEPRRRSGRRADG